jgi:hypothetical protein
MTTTSAVNNQFNIHEFMNYRSNDYEYLIKDLEGFENDEHKKFYITLLYCEKTYGDQFVINPKDVGKIIDYKETRDVNASILKNLENEIEKDKYFKMTDVIKGTITYNWPFLSLKGLEKYCINNQRAKCKNLYKLYKLNKNITRKNNVVFEEEDSDENNEELLNLSEDIKRFQKNCKEKCRQKYVVYLLDIGNGYFKFGRSSNFTHRFTQHLRKISRNIRPVNIWIFPFDEVSKNVETELELFASQKQMLTTYRNNEDLLETEIINTSDIEPFVHKINQLAKKYTDIFEKDFGIYQFREVCNTMKNLEPEDTNTKLSEKLIKNGILDDVLAKMLEIYKLIEKNTIRYELNSDTQEEEEEEKQPDKLLCSTCGETKEPADVHFNQYTKKYFSICIDCDKKKTNEKIKENESKLTKIKEEMLKAIKEKRTNREKIYEGEPIKCKKCKTLKSRREFEFYRRKGELYVDCKECRGGELTYKSLEGNDVIECSHCHHDIHLIPHKNGDTYYTRCEKCRSVDKPHDEKRKNDPKRQAQVSENKHRYYEENKNEIRSKQNNVHYENGRARTLARKRKLNRN